MVIKKHKEKRRFLRISDFSLVKYRLVLNEAKQQHEFKVTNLRDIGEGGVGLWASEALPIGNLIEIRISFPPLDVPISTLAKMIWSRRVGSKGQYMMGLQFVGIEETFRKVIAERVKKTDRKT